MHAKTFGPLKSAKKGKDLTVNASDCVSSNHANGLFLFQWFSVHRKHCNARTLFHCIRDFAGILVNRTSVIPVYRFYFPVFSPGQATSMGKENNTLIIVIKSDI